jgi:hypothetical protein
MMATLRIGQRVAFYDDEGEHQAFGTVEELGCDSDVLVRVSPECDFYDHTAWYETRNGISGRFWWVPKDELRHYGPPQSVTALSRLIVSELTK